jgi:hypothetical protein
MPVASSGAGHAAGIATLVTPEANAAPMFGGRSDLRVYSGSLIELDADISRIMDEIHADAPAFAQEAYRTD